MRKIRSLVGLVLSTLIGFALAGQVYAGSNLMIRLEQPKSPTNLTSFNLNFVTLDILNRPVTVKCFKQSPSDAGFVQFGSDIALPTGGNSGKCEVNSVFGDQGTYQFKVEANAGGEIVSDSTSVQYDNSGPGDPKDYNKEKVSNCEYKIHFKSADDAGATVKIEIYRSENTSFNTDDGTRVGSVSLSSNEAKDFPDTIPNCDKTYYYAIRAFDAAGNGSGVVGDSVVTITTVTIAGTPAPAQGAIALAGGAVLGEEAGAGTEVGKGEALGEASPTAEQVTISRPSGLVGAITSLVKTPAFWIILLLALGGFWYARRKQTQG